MEFCFLLCVYNILIYESENYACLETRLWIAIFSHKIIIAVLVLCHSKIVFFVLRDGGSRILRNVGTYLLDHTAIYLT